MKPGVVIALWAMSCAPVQANWKFVPDWWREGFVARHPELVKK